MSFIIVRHIRQKNKATFMRFDKKVNEEHLAGQWRGGVIWDGRRDVEDAVAHGPLGPFSLKTVRRTVFRALEPRRFAPPLQRRGIIS
jgi:hypothetical protein